MVSIFDIPLADLKLFLSENGISIPKKEKDLYDLAKDVIVNNEVDFYPDIIIDWIIAYNFFLAGGHIKTYDLIEINSLSTKELMELGDKLGFDTDDININSIINVLKYLNRLNESNTIGLLPNEILLLEILNKMGERDFSAFCSTNSQFKSICQDDKFWEKIYHYNFNLTHKIDRNLLYQKNYQLAYGLDKLINTLDLAYDITDLYNSDTLILEDHQLKAVPKEIGLLTNLEDLTIEFSRLLQLPKELFSLTKLTNLSVVSAGLSRLPKEIGLLTNLVELKLSSNIFKLLPREIGKLHKLRKLDLNYNNLQELPMEIGDLVNLKELFLTENDLKELPEDIGDLHELEILHLGENNLVSLPKEIGNLFKLNILDLNRNKMLKSLPRTITNLSSLKELDITKTKLPTSEKNYWEQNLPNTSVIF